MYRTPLTQGKLVGGRRGVVWMPSIDGTKKYPFRPKEIRFLHAYASGVPLNEISQKLDLSEEKMLTLLKRKRVKAYLSELDEMDAELIARSAKGRIAKEILNVWDGKEKKTKDQLDTVKELWSRIWPKPQGQGGDSGQKLEVNINIGKLEEAVKRQQMIDAELVNEQK